jgi:hypothetical protein
MLQPQRHPCVYNDYLGCGETLLLRVQRLRPWNESTVTWNTKPTMETTAITTTTVPVNYGWMTWNITSDVQDIVSGVKHNYGWVIIDEHTGGYPMIYFYSREYGANTPVLSINHVNKTEVGNWHFDEGTGSIAYDATQFHNDGTITGATWTTGHSGSGLYFHGGGQWVNGDGVTVPHATSLDITSPFCVSAWINAIGSDQWLTIVDKYRYADGIAWGYTLYLDNGRIRLTVYSGSNGQSTAIGTSDLRNHGWKYVCGVWDGTHIRVYVNGTFEGEQNWSHPPESTTNNLGIGKRLSGWGGYMPFYGTIDEVSIKRMYCGDVNNDGIINVGDVVYLINYLFRSGQQPQPLKCTGDCNGDSVVDVGDVVYLINYLFRAGPIPTGCCK